VKNEEKESAMHAPTLIRRAFAQQHEEHLRHRSTLRNLHAHLRGWARGENLVASLSLAAIVLIVLALVYQAMAI
jgi:hypothetical protein